LKAIKAGVRTNDGTPFTGIRIRLDRETAKEFYDILDRIVEQATDELGNGDVRLNHLRLEIYRILGYR
jgi:hypothetical protein